MGQVPPFGVEGIGDPLLPSWNVPWLSILLRGDWQGWNGPRADLPWAVTTPACLDPGCGGERGTWEKLGILGKGFRPQSSLGAIWP